MIIDRETGQALDYSDVYSAAESPTDYRKEVYKETLEWNTILTRHCLEDWFREDIANRYHKVRWSNNSMDTLLDIGADVADKYRKLASLLVARNYVFDTNSNIAAALGVDKSNLSKTLKKMEKNGLLKVCSEHGGGKRHKKIVMNPTLVFKTYNQIGEGFNSSLYFSRVHEVYVDKWIKEFITTQESAIL